MIPPAFDYHAPASLSEAIALLSRLGDSAKVLSGGQSLLPLLKLRLGRPLSNNVSSESKTDSCLPFSPRASRCKAPNCPSAWRPCTSRASVSP